MSCAPANSACFVLARASANAASQVNISRTNPFRTVGHVAVNSFANGNVPLGLTVMESLSQAFRNILENNSERNFVEAAFGRPLLLVLASRLNQPREAIFAVAVASNLDCFLDSNVI